jgi:L-asparagine transporter-like permease
MSTSQVVTSSVALNAVMLLIVGITFIFCLGDLDSVLNTPTGQPMIQVFYNATQSVAGTSIMVVVIIIILLSACVGQVATSSRQIWSFARDKGKSRYSTPPPAPEAKEYVMLIQCGMSQASLGLVGLRGFHQLGIFP